MKSNKRKCKVCKKEKYIEEFYPRKGGYRTHSCKDCLKIKQKSYEIDKTFLSQYHKERNLKVKYNITAEEYKRILKDQNGKCAICGTSQEDLRISLAVDHDHKTGKIRGLLCNSCNQGLGYFKDNQSNIENALYYLILHK